MLTGWTPGPVPGALRLASCHDQRHLPSLADALAAGTVVLDGGMSNQLESAGHDLSDELWSARLLAERPEAVTEAHLAYFRAGASVAITASYQATFEGFGEARHRPGRGRAAARAQRGTGPGGGTAGPHAGGLAPVVGGRLRRAVRRHARGRLRVPGPVRAGRGRAGAVPPAPDRGAGRRRTGRAGAGDRPGRRRGRRAAARGAGSGSAGLAVVHRRRPADAGRPAPGGRRSASPPTRTR